MNNQNDVRVRMAPSPTGFFHVGSARTALYNWLFAKHNKGTFILRVEDTDIERSSQNMTRVILDGLNWLGIKWNEENLYYQSKRLNIYEKYVRKLIQNGHAYYCFCSPEELEKEKQAAYKNKKDWKYDRRCLNLSDAERAEKEKSNTPRAIRFLVPDHAVAYKDIIYGEITREAQDIEDFVIMRANGMPTYNLVCVVDDYEMGISHVIRAVDHITNTPKQILLYETLKLPKPQFAHLPLILDEDKKKLSKRHGAVSLRWYQEQGFLPDAMINYLVLLGWSPGDNTELFMDKRKRENLGTVDMDALVAKFTLERVNQANAVFDMRKLEWMNQQYILELAPEIFKEKLKPFAINTNLITDEEIKQKEQENQWFTKVSNLMKPRLKVLSDIDEQGRFFFKDDFEYDRDAFKKHLNKETLVLMKKFLMVIRDIDPFTYIQIEIGLRNYGDDNGLKVKQWIHPLRVFVTGKSGGPGLFDTMELIGKQRCIGRIQKILNEHGRLDGRKQG